MATGFHHRKKHFPPAYCQLSWSMGFSDRKFRPYSRQVPKQSYWCLRRWKRLFAVGSDKSFWAILASNLLTVVMAVWLEWGILALMWPCWMQSVIIGVFAHRRILALKEFSVEDWKETFDEPVEATRETAEAVAKGFALFYGGVHLGYFWYLVRLTVSAVHAGGFVTTDGSGETIGVYIGEVAQRDVVGFAIAAVAFWFSHRASSAEHRESDLARKPNILTLAGLPFARILPIHVTLLCGLFCDLASGGSQLVWLFGGLKTAADLLMHRMEHAILQGGEGEDHPGEEGGTSQS